MIHNSQFLILHLTAVAVALWVAFGVAWAIEHRIFVEPLAAWRRQPKFRKTLVGIVLIGIVAYAGTKPDPTGGDETGGASTNDVAQVEGNASTNEELRVESEELDGILVTGSHLQGLDGSEQGLTSSILNSSLFTLNSSSASFSLAAVGTNEAFDFTPPETAAVATNWLLHGASTQPLRLSFDDWVFPFGEEGYSNFTVFACGEVMPGEVNANRFLVPFGASLGIAPVANWHLLPPNCNSVIRLFGDSVISPVSLFWSGFSPSNTLLLTWQNALLDRAATNPVSFQAELKPSGGFVFRYDLSRLVTDGPLSNAVIKAQSEDANFADVPTTNLTSLAFHTHDERLCDEKREEFDEKIGDADPYACPEGSTNTVLEHVFYSGTTNGAFAYPQSTDGNAVLMVSVSGSGSGELMVGSTFVPLVGRPAPVSAPRLFAAPPPSPSTLAVTVPRGSTQKVYMRGDATLSVSLDSGDFAFGSLPDLSGRRFVGWINFPFVNATVPCIHDYNAKKKLVSLPVGRGADALTCTWLGTDEISALNFPPRSAELTGRFDGDATTPVSYALSHPNYLFGTNTYTQTARFCPQPPEDDDDNDGNGYYGGGWESGGTSFCPCRFWGICREGCDCGCSCTGDEDGPDDPPPPEDYDEASTNYPHMSGVLKIRDPLEYADPIHLTVPNEHRNCCPCPDHATNWVATVYRSGRLKVVDAATGMDFRSSCESLDVRIAGVSPSESVGDAAVAFAANGDVCFEGEYTTLGVGIGKWDVDLRLLNGINPDFGLPIPVCTNDDQMVDLCLVTNVRLPFGNIHVGFEDASGDFALWAWDSDLGEYAMIADTETGPLDISFAGWRQMVGGSTDQYSSQTPVYVTSASTGTVTLVYRYWGVADGELVEDEARQVISSVDPLILADVNRDGAIDDADVGLYHSGRTYRFWTNPAIDDRADGADNVVNFFPVKVDLSRLTDAWGDHATYTLRNWDADIRCCALKGVASDSASSIWTDDVRTKDNEQLSAATPTPIGSTGIDLGTVFPDGQGMLAVTAGDDVDYWSSPEIVIHLGEAEVYRFKLPMSLRSVRNMYRFLNIRGCCGDDRSVQTNSGNPVNLPDEETDGRHFVFVHGYNVNPGEARDWADAMFKRLLLSGSRSAFTAVTWYGDDTQIYVPFVGNVTPDYYSNVEHAFGSAFSFASVVAALPGSSKFIAAHSLGNMLVSSAVVDHGLSCERFFMFDAAVPLEAYDSFSVTDTTRDNMTPSNWRNYANRLRATHWFELFGDEDARKSLTWKGRFSGLANSVNYYSSEEDVLANADGQSHAFPATAYIWMNQETRKGVWPALLPGNNEAGWSFNSAYDIPNPDFLGQGDGLMMHRPPQLAAQLSDSDLRLLPFFGSFDDMSICTTNVLTTIPQRTQLLADAIPAESYAAGRNPVAAWGVSRNVDMIQFRRAGTALQWNHGFIKSGNYNLIYRLFKDVIERSR